MSERESDSFDRDINEMLDRVEKKIKELRKLNRPALDALDRQEIERRVKALEGRDETDREEMKRRIEMLENRSNLLMNRLVWVLVALGATIWIIGIILGVI